MQDGGNILVFFSHWWDLEQYQQIIERIGPTPADSGRTQPPGIHTTTLSPPALWMKW